MNHLRRRTTGDVSNGSVDDSTSEARLLSSDSSRKRTAFPHPHRVDIAHSNCKHTFSECTAAHLYIQNKEHTGFIHF